MVSKPLHRPTGDNTWDDDQGGQDGRRGELIDGIAYDGAPAPGARHEYIVMELAARLHHAFRGGVKEVWPITPYPSRVEICSVDGGASRFQGGYGAKENLRAPVFSELRLDLATVFDFPLEPGERIEGVEEIRAFYQPKGTRI